MASHTPPASSVVVADLGVVGYYAQRRMIDSFGLIVPNMATNHEPAAAVQKFHPDYVVATQYFFFQQFVHSDWFSAEYSPIAQFSTSNDDFSPMTVFERIRASDDSQPLDAQPNYVPLSTEWPFVQLSGMSLPNGDQTWSGGTLTVRLEWHALQAAAQDYNVFVHLLDANGALVDQLDGPPNGQPVTAWKAGKVITDIRRIVLPPSLPAGDYHLEIGWYDWRSGGRLPWKGKETLEGVLNLPVTIHNQWPGGSGLP
jgi:hypothetical protein